MESIRVSLQKMSDTGKEAASSAIDALTQGGVSERPSVYIRSNSVAETLGPQGAAADPDGDEIPYDDDHSPTTPLDTGATVVATSSKAATAAHSQPNTSNAKAQYEDGGIIWHATVVADGHAFDPKHLQADGKTLKLRRPLPQIRASDFFGKLEERTTEHGGGGGGEGASHTKTSTTRWVLPAIEGGLNGWPGIQYELELLSVTARVRKRRYGTLPYIKRFWDKAALAREAKALRRGHKGGGSVSPGVLPRPTFPTMPGKGGAQDRVPLPYVRVTLRAPAWTSKGYSEAAPGHLFWVTCGGIDPRPTSPPPAPPPKQPTSPGGPPVAVVPGAPSPGWTAKEFPRLAALPDGRATKCFFGTGALDALRDGTMYPATAAAARPQPPRPPAAAPAAPAAAAAPAPAAAAAAAAGAAGAAAAAEEAAAAAAAGSLASPPPPTPPFPVNPVMTQVTTFAHRYAVDRESPKDLVTYHAACLVQWDHGRFSTLIELAWRCGVSGYGGKSNWYHDRDAIAHDGGGGGGGGGPSLLRCLPPALQAPWDSTKAEIRCYDVPLRDQGDLAAYLARYTGKGSRFLHPEIAAVGRNAAAATAPGGGLGSGGGRRRAALGAAAVTVVHRTQADLMRYLLNYIVADSSYSEEARNCQTFAADLHGFLTCDSTVEPYHSLIRILYKSKPLAFLRDFTIEVDARKCDRDEGCAEKDAGEVEEVACT